MLAQKMQALRNDVAASKSNQGRAHSGDVNQVYNPNAAPYDGKNNRVASANPKFLAVLAEMAAES